MITWLKNVLKKNAVVYDCARRLSVYKEKIRFPGSKQYWESRYAKFGNSGAGSYGECAVYKASVLNQFVKDQNINTVIEFGCGDGNQLSLFTFPNYIGLDVSQTAIKGCIERFQSEKTKSFFLFDSACFLDHGEIFKAELVLSLDVLYHLVEDVGYLDYLRHLFSASKKYAVIYSSDTNIQTKHLSPHCRLREFTKDIERYFPEWRLVQKMNTPIISTPPIDFYIYEKITTEL